MEEGDGGVRDGEGGEGEAEAGEEGRRGEAAAAEPEGDVMSERYRGIPTVLRRIAGQAHVAQAMEAVLVLRTASGAIDVFGFGPQAPGPEDDASRTAALLDAGKKRIAELEVDWAGAA